MGDMLIIEGGKAEHVELARDTIEIFNCVIRPPERQ